MHDSQAHALMCCLLLGTAVALQHPHTPCCNAIPLRAQAFAVVWLGASAVMLLQLCPCCAAPAAYQRTLELLLAMQTRLCCQAHLPCAPLACAAIADCCQHAAQAHTAVCSRSLQALPCNAAPTPPLLRCAPYVRAPQPALCSMYQQALLCCRSHAACHSAHCKELSLSMCVQLLTPERMPHK